MFTKNNNKKKVRCFLCCCNNNSQTTFINIKTIVCLELKRTLKHVIEYLAKCAKLELELSTESVLCYDCYKNVSNFDENMRKIMKQRQQLIKSVQMCMMYIDSDYEEELQIFALEEEDFFSDVIPDDDEITEAVQEVLTNHASKTPSIVSSYVANEPKTDTEVDESSEIMKQNDEQEVLTDESMTNTSKIIAENNVEQNSSVILKTVEQDEKETIEEPIVDTQPENNSEEGNDMTEDKLSCENNTDDSESTESSDHEVKSKNNKKVMRKKTFKVRCFYCGISLRNRNEMRKHRETCHKVYSCNLCKYVSHNEYNVILHKNIHEGKKESECPLCDKVYTKKYHCMQHLQTHLQKDKYQCEKCGLSFFNPVKFKLHYMQHDAEENPLFCNICKQQFKTIKTFKTHEITHRKDRPRYVCEHCGKVFSHRYTRTEHLRTKHKEQNQDSQDDAPSCKRIKKAQCIICKGSYLNKEQLAKHMQKQHDVIVQPVATLPLTDTITTDKNIEN